MLQINIPKNELKTICEKWHITEVAMFGSVVRNDFTDESDIDILVTFEADFRYTFSDLMDIQEAMEDIFERRVDLAEYDVVASDSNHYRRKAILDSAEVIYAR